MGLWSAVGSAISGVCSCIGNAISSAFSGVCSALGHIGRTAIDLVIKPPSLDIFKVIVKAVGWLAEKLGLKEPEEKPEELGDRAIQAQEKGIKPENYNSTREYIQDIREKTTFDQKKFDKLSPQEKLERESLGTSIYTKGVEEEMKMELPSEFLVDIGKLNLTGPQMEQLIAAFKKQGFDSMQPMSQYLRGNLAGDKVSKAGTAMKEAAAVQNPGLSRDEINAKILKAQETIRNTQI